MGHHPSGRLFGITGTPGTGKKTLAPLVASELGLPSFSLNELAVSCGLMDRRKLDAEVDVEAFKGRMRDVLQGPALVYGHLLPYVLERRSVARVVVLRCEPSVLKERLRARRYPAKKILQNVEAELIGLISSDTVRALGADRAVEFDTTRSDPRLAATSVVALLTGRRSRVQSVDWIQAYGSPSKLRALLSGPATGWART